ncbi:hypothetical protein [Arthrobacter sp. USHLN218]|uniref:hypothetical protein n=1 Tax=Arthrobacter sp. USHLN218 TaxID=3081232 RepID=UPI00301B01B3
MNIPDEAVEAAQKALDAAVDSHLPDAFSSGCEANGTECEDEYDCLWDMARIALEAAAPAIQAAALRAAAAYAVDHVAVWDGNSTLTDVSTETEYVDIAAWLRARADELEAGK